MVRLTRRAYVLGAAGTFVFFGTSSTIRAQAAKKPKAPSPEEGLYPVVPNVAHAWMSTFKKLNEATILTEPITIFFWVFSFADTAAATNDFDVIAKFYHDYIAKKAKYPVTETSIGRVGDERKAYFDDTEAATIASVIRVGSVIQTSMALSFGGDLAAYMANLLSGAVPESDADPIAFIPDIADLPPGWQILWEDPIDITVNAQGQATPVP